MTLGAEIKARREARGMSQRDLKLALESAHQQNYNRPRYTIKSCPICQIEQWESGHTLPSRKSIRALAYVLDPNPEELSKRWEEVWDVEHDYRLTKGTGIIMARGYEDNDDLPEILKAPPEERAPPVTPTRTPEPGPSGTVDLCMTDGEECVRFDGADMEEAVRRFREFLEFQILPGGGGAVFVSWAGYPKSEAARTDGAE